MKNSINIHWLAVQPTPYNKYLFDSLKETDKFSFKLYYSLKVFEELPFQEKLTDEIDYFFTKYLGIDWSILWKAISSRDWFVCVGWDDTTKLLVLFLRGILKLPVAFWTDSINTKEIRKNRVSFLVKKLLLRGANKVFTTGEFGRAKMLESGLVTKEKKVISLPFFVPLPDVYKLENNVETELNLLLLARLIPRKGIDIALEAVKNLNNKGYRVKLKIGGVGELKEFIEQYIIDNNQQDNIVLLGWINSEELNQQRLLSNVLIHPVTEHDPYPLVVLESLACGLPVIGSNLAGSVIDRVKNEQNGFVINPNIEELEESIKKCFDKETLKLFTINARKEAETWNPSIAIKTIFETLN